MKQSFFITGKLPGTNDCVRKHWRIYSNLKNQSQFWITNAIRRAKLAPMEYAAITFEWREPDQKRDWDNVMFAQKFVLDALVKRKIIRNDSWAYITGIQHRVVLDASNPGVLVTLEER